MTPQEHQRLQQQRRELIAALRRVELDVHNDADVALLRRALGVCEKEVGVYAKHPLHFESPALFTRSDRAAHSGRLLDMKLEINTNGAWRTVLRDLTSEDLSTVETATESLCDVAYRHGSSLGFRLAGTNGEALSRCDATDCVWVPAQQVAG